MKSTETIFKVNNFQRLMFLLLCRVLEYKLTGAEILEMTDRNTNLAMELIFATIKCDSYESDMYFCLFRILHELVRVDTYIKPATPAEQLIMILSYCETMDTIHIVYTSY